MGEVTSMTLDGINEFIKEAEVVGTDLILTKGNGGIITVPLPEGVTQGDIDAAIAALVDSSPTTLDTLNELAAALGDDANLAANLTASIAAVKSGAMGVVIHGAVAGTARPAGYGAIHWIGTVSPTNAIDNDLWTDPSA